MANAKAKVGVIGGSGLGDALCSQTEGRAVEVQTPFGAPSDKIITTVWEGVEIAILNRHGPGHSIPPSSVNYRANIYALKALGCTHVIASGAVGSLREEIRPKDLVIPDQIIDRTKSRVNTFFGRGLVAHVGFAEPFCPALSDVLYQVAKEMGVKVHKAGTYIAMEGPLFSTKAESYLYRSWGASVIGMTALPEAKLAREAELCYATLAFATDYDCWHEAEETVTIEMVISNLMKNVDTAKRIIRAAASRVPVQRDCPCATALANAIVTASHLIPAEVKRDLALLIGKYVQ